MASKDRILAQSWHGTRLLGVIVAVPLMVILMIVSTNSVVVGQFLLPTYLRTIGWLAIAIMLLASLGFLVSSLRGIH